MIVLATDVEVLSEFPALAYHFGMFSFAVSSATFALLPGNTDESSGDQIAFERVHELTIVFEAKQVCLSHFTQ